MPEPLVEIASYYHPQLAGMAHGVLASAGIAALLDGEGLAGVAPHLVPVVGGIRLRVPASVAAEARAILEEQGLADDASHGVPVPAPLDEAEAGDPADESVRQYLRRRP